MNPVLSDSLVKPFQFAPSPYEYKVTPFENHFSQLTLSVELSVKALAEGWKIVAV
jgi:hypothetical protein